MNDEVMELVKVVFKELDSFLESVELAPLLELMSECLDRFVIHYLFIFIYL